MTSAISSYHWLLIIFGLRGWIAMHQEGLYEETENSGLI
ncbi:hypothetical protein SSYIS1_24110 [Serratia symbiotica]|uniref:Uncharacterized protein n=1 Tax=Serratia symbiotica TaxID=138074 RepID=A0A455VU44_9GAMM|nr:hypothetical protein SSYIS1_24110 [Serratia symbiotica]